MLFLYEPGDIVDAFLGDAPHFFAREQAEGVRDHRDRQVGAAQR